MLKKRKSAQEATKWHSMVGAAGSAQTKSTKQA